MTAVLAVRLIIQWCWACIRGDKLSKGYEWVFVQYNAAEVVKGTIAMFELLIEQMKHSTQVTECLIRDSRLM